MAAFDSGATSGLQATHGEAAAAYVKAADILDTEGWIQGRNVNDDGHLCLGAAINKAADRYIGATSNDLMSPLARWLLSNRLDEIRQAFADRFRDVTEDGNLPARFMPDGQFGDGDALWIIRRWNDYGHMDPNTAPSDRVQPGEPRTKEQAVEALRGAAAEIGPTTTPDA